MARLEKVLLTGSPSATDQGNIGPNHVSSYQIVVDQQMPSFFAMRTAQGHIAGTVVDPSVTYRVPQRGDWFLFDENGSPVDDIWRATHSLADQAAFEAANPNGYADYGAFALDFVPTPIDPCSWAVRVTHREYKSRGYETIETSAFFEDFGPSSITALPPSPTTAQLKTTLDVPTVIGYRWVTREYDVPLTYIITGTTPAASALTLRNPNGEPYPPAQRTERIKIVRFTKATFGGSVALAMDGLYGNTVNEDTFSFDGQSVAKHHARYLGAEVSDPITANGQTYNLTTYEVEIGNRPQYRTVPAVGSFYIDGDLNKVTAKDADGFQTAQVFPLQSDGNEALTPATQHIDTVLDFEVEVYADIFE